MTSVTRWGPSAIQCSTSASEHVRLHLNAFRGEPAISRFDWHFTATHSSSEPSSTDTGAVLQPETIRPSTWPWVDHLVSGPLPLTREGQAFPAPCLDSVSLRLRPYGDLTFASERDSPVHSAKGTPSPQAKAYGAPTACRRPVSGSISLPSRGSFHLSLTVLVHYRWPGVFSLGGWSPRIPPGFLVSRGTWVVTASLPLDRYRTVTVSGAAFQRTSRKQGVSYSLAALPHCRVTPTTLNAQRRQAWHALSLGWSAFARRY